MNSKQGTARSGMFRNFVAVLAVATIGALLVAITLSADLRLYVSQMASVAAAKLVLLTNETRQGSGTYGLIQNDLLTAAAQAKADDMAKKGYFSHVSPDGSPFWSWIQQAGYSYTYAGENLAINFSDSEDVIEAWLESPSHRANVLSNKFTEVGIAVAEGQYKGRLATFVVQMFGTPRTVTEQANIGTLTSSVEGNVRTLAIVGAWEMGTSSEVLGDRTEQSSVSRLEVMLSELQALVLSLGIR